MTFTQTPTPLFPTGQAEVDYALGEFTDEGHTLTPGDWDNVTVEVLVDGGWQRINTALVEYMDLDACDGSDDHGPHRYTANDHGGATHNGRYCTLCIDEGVRRCCRDCAFEG